MKHPLGIYRIAGEKVELFVTRYQHSNTLAVIGVCSDGIPWGKLTVNLPELGYDEVAVDINNRWDYESVLMKTGAFKRTFKRYRSGFLDYPVLYTTKSFDENLA